MNAEQLAELFHATYERLAPEHGYITRRESAKPWADVSETNRKLMIATCGEVLQTLKQELKIEERNLLLHDYETYLLLLAPHWIEDGIQAESLRDRTAQLLKS